MRGREGKEGGREGGKGGREGGREREGEEGGREGGKVSEVREVEISSFNTFIGSCSSFIL